jgi:hypothetical protein
MKITRGSIKDLHSCNGCKRGTLKKDGLGVEYPYDTVTVIEGNGISIRLCDECLEELKRNI